MPTKTQTQTPAEEIAQIDTLLLTLASSIIETESILSSDISNIAASEVSVAVSRRTEARNLLSQLQEQQRALNARKQALSLAMEQEAKADQIAVLTAAMAKLRQEFNELQPEFDAASERLRSAVAQLKAIEGRAMGIRNNLHILGVDEGIPLAFYSRADRVPRLRPIGPNDFNFAGARFVVEAIEATNQG